MSADPLAAQSGLLAALLKVVMMPPSARTRAARDARATFPQSHARAACCAWQGEASEGAPVNQVQRLLPFEQRNRGDRLGVGAIELDSEQGTRYATWHVVAAATEIDG